METIDSSEQQLDFHEILIRYVNAIPSYSLPDMSPTGQIAVLLKELSAPNVEYEQLGNSIIIITSGKNAPESIIMRVVSVDTPQQIMRYLGLYMDKLYKKGTRYIYTVVFDDTYPRLLNAAAKLMSR